MGDDAWTVVGGKGSKQGGKSKVLSLKAAEKLNEAQQENWRLQVGESSEESMDGWGTQHQGRKRGKKARGDVCTIDRVSATEAKVTRAAELIKTAPFYQLLATVLDCHCFVPNPSLSASTVEMVNTEECSPGDYTKESPPSGPWCTPGWKWAPGPNGPSELIVYGLGSPVISSVSCDQLALARLLIQHHGFASAAAAGRALVYDPVLSAADQTILQRCEFRVLDVDEKGARAASAPVLFWMPHCEAALYDNLLKANWSRDKLPYLAILGNSFQTYEDRWEMKARSATGRPNYILAIRPYLLEVPLGDTGAHLVEGFTDTSLHLFPPSALPDAGTAFWDEM